MAGRDGMTYLTSLAVKNLLAQGDASSSTTGTAGQVLVSGGADAPVSWANAGTGTLPIASTATAGIVSLALQNFAGDKIFKGDVNLAGQVTLQPSGTVLLLAVNTGVYSVGLTENTLTMTNGPAEVSGNPSTYLRITGNGLNLVIPAWTGT